MAHRRLSSIRSFTQVPANMNPATMAMNVAAIAENFFSAKRSSRTERYGRRFM
jgi:hypothetical protein